MSQLDKLALKVGSSRYQTVKKNIKKKGMRLDRKCRLVRGTYVIPPLLP